MDLVDVIRCKDCKFMEWDSEPHDAIYCKLFKFGWTNSDDFCSFAKKKENDK